MEVAVSKTKHDLEVELDAVWKATKPDYTPSYLGAEHTCLEELENSKNGEGRVC